MTAPYTWREGQKDMRDGVLTLDKAYLGMNVRRTTSVAAREDGLEGC